MLSKGIWFGCALAVGLLGTELGAAADDPRKHLNTEGMNYGSFYQSIYLGRFHEISVPRRQMKLSVLGHVEMFSDTCPGHLPADKVGIERITTTITKYKGMEVHRKTERSDAGVFVEPRFAKMYVHYANTQDADLFPFLAESMRQPDKSRGGWLEFIRHQSYHNYDYKLLYERHGCGSEKTQRYIENLYRYVTGSKSAQEGSGELFLPACEANIAGMVNGIQTRHCGCLYKLFHGALNPFEVQDLEDGFTAERFLLTAVSRVGLHEKVRACIR